MIGGSGNDRLTGDGGNDTFVISGTDTITDFTPGDDKLSFGSSPRNLNLNYTTDGNDLVISSGSHRATLPSRTDLTGLGAANFDFSPDGHVRLTNNTTTAPTGERGSYTIYGGEGDNRLTGSSNNDLINGNGGDDNITGGNGNDTLNGGAGDDTIEGGAGADIMAGGDGDGDTLSYANSSRGNTTADTDPNPRSGVTVSLTSIGGAAGENLGTHAEGDTINGGFEILIGSRYDDRLTGASGTEVIKGGSGNDWLTGGGGGNHLEGGPGKDKLEGATGDFLSYEGSGGGVNVNLNDTSTVTLSPADATLFVWGAILLLLLTSSR